MTKAILITAHRIVLAIGVLVASICGAPLVPSAKTRGTYKWRTSSVRSTSWVQWFGRCMISRVRFSYPRAKSRLLPIAKDAAR